MKGESLILNKLGHMTKMATMSIYGKAFQKSSSILLQCVYKSSSCDDLDRFYGKFNIGYICR